MSHKSKGQTLTIRIDTDSGGVYLGLREDLKAVRTEVRQQWPLVAVDFSKNGTLIGVEAVGMAAVNIGEICRIAKVRFTAAAIKGATIRSEALEREAVCA